MLVWIFYGELTSFLKILLGRVIIFLSGQLLGPFNDFSTLDIAQGGYFSSHSFLVHFDFHSVQKWKSKIDNNVK